MYLRQDDVLGIGLTLLGDGVHEGLGGEAGRLGGCQALGHTVHIHILGKRFLQIQDCKAMVTMDVTQAKSDSWQGLALVDMHKSLWD